MPGFSSLGSWVTQAGLAPLAITPAITIRTRRLIALADPSAPGRGAPTPALQSCGGARLADESDEYVGMVQQAPSWGSSVPSGTSPPGIPRPAGRPCDSGAPPAPAPPGVTIDPPPRWHSPLHLCHSAWGSPGRPHLWPDLMTRHRLTEPAAAPERRAGAPQKWHKVAGSGTLLAQHHRNPTLPEVVGVGHQAHDWVA